MRKQFRVWAVLFTAVSAFAQQSSIQQSLPDAPAPSTEAPSAEEAKQGGRILGIIPNFRSLEDGQYAKPLTPKQKFKLASQDAFDPSAFLVAGFLGGISYAENNYPEWGHGGTAIGKYYAGGFADQAIGDYMTEAVLPTLLHQDPRYYVLGKGGFKKRLWYAVKQEVSAYGDDGKRRFNTSEIAGNAIAAGISTAYYPAQERNFGQVANKWGQQIYSDAFFNVLKEFWPDMRRSIFKQKD